MNARRRYEVAFLALGWLLLISAVLRAGAAAGIRRGYGHVESAISRLAQSLSNAEGDALAAVRKKNRREELSSFRAMSASVDALKRPIQPLLGAYDGGFPQTFQGFERLEQELGKRFHIVSFYQAWGDRPDQRTFPARMVETVDRIGSVPMIAWEPWVKDFDPVLRPNLAPLAEREYASLAAIAKGDYDFYVVEWARGAAAYGKPIFLRFAHEMNDPYRYPWGPQNGNKPDDFIAAWRHVHAVFQKMNATNVLWVWSPHISMPWFEFYYPGDGYVDWIGTGVLNYGTVAPWSRWWTFQQIVEKAYPALEKLDKPVMITEFGSLTVGGDAAGWYRDAFADIRTRYPSIRAVVFFNQASDVTLSATPLDWSVLKSPQVMEAVSGELKKGISGPPPSVRRREAS